VTIDVGRHLEWEGAFNVRDLGGYPTADGRTTRWGAVVRSDSPTRLTGAGWDALREHGIRTIVDLRDPAVETRGYEEQAEGIDLVRVAVLQIGDEEFWAPLRAKRDAYRFYNSALERWPREFGDAVRAVARAQPGGVLVHCQVGRDRTGIVAALVLSAVGVAPEDVAIDYGLSEERLKPLYERWRNRGELHDTATKTQLDLGNSSRSDAMLRLLAGLDVPAYLRDAGVTDADVEALRERLLEAST
jgi:protein-tyrosine phosphatase